jgi:hypothetical protein
MGRSVMTRKLAKHLSMSELVALSRHLREKHKRIRDGEIPRAAHAKALAVECTKDLGFEVTANNLRALFGSRWELAKALGVPKIDNLVERARNGRGKSNPRASQRVLELEGRVDELAKALAGLQVTVMTLARDLGWKDGSSS